RYQPQLGQTVWGSLAWWHCGHSLRAGASTRQAEARRLRLFDFEVFFLGTAMSGLSLVALEVGAQRVERVPPRVVVGARTAARALVEVRPARRAQPEAVLPAERGQG